MAKELPKNFDFHFIKSNSFRVVHCDGVWGGTTPRGYITMSVYSERSPLPRKVTHHVTEEGIIGDEIIERRECREGIVREVDVEMILDLDMAKSLVRWLGGHIEFLENRQNTGKTGN